MRATIHLRRAQPGPQPAMPSGARRGGGPVRRAASRLCLAVGLLGAVAVAAAVPAYAAGDTIGGCVLDKVSEAKKEHGSLDAVKALPSDDLATLEKDLEGCLESPNPIFPALEEIIWGGLAFVVLFAFMWWKGFPAVKRAMDARSEKIRADLDAADTAKADALRTKSEYEAELADAKTAAASIIDEARVSADRLAQDLQARAEADIADQRARAAADIEASRRQAIDDLRSDVAAIAVGAAERVVGASLDDEVHRALVDAYIDEVAGAGSNGSGGDDGGS